MKRVLLALFCVLFTNFLVAQQQYTVDGQTYSLYTEVDGTLTLLWNSVDGEYRYFAKKGNSITELKNTKSNGSFQEEYKGTLQLLTNDAQLAVDDVKLTKNSLRDFVVTYNMAVDPNFNDTREKTPLTTRLGGFAGISNNAYFINPDNTFLPVLGIDLELVELKKLRRHSINVQFAQTIASSDYDFSSSELSLSYRFKFIKSDKIDLFINTKFASYIYVSRDITVQNSAGDDEVISGSGGDLRTPGSFGLGADIALGMGYLTLAYNDIVSVGLETGDEFPVYLTVGYKFSL